MLYPDVQQPTRNGRSNGRPPTGSGVEERQRELINYLTRLSEEARAAIEGTDLEKADDLLRFARGQQWPEETPKGIVDFVLNMANDIIMRKTGLLTDSRPVMQVLTANTQWEEQARGLEKIIQACWHESSWMGEELPKGIAMAAVTGCNIGIMRWDPLADRGRGDLRPHFIDPRAVGYDPSVTRTHRLHEGEYVETRAIRSIASLVSQFGERALTITPDAEVSTYPEPDNSRRGYGLFSGVLDAGRRYLRGRPRPRQRMREGGIERCVEHHMWFQDFQRYGPDEPMAGQPIYSLPRKIRHVVWAGDVVLCDEPNPHWFDGYPHEILDWGMELEHPMGLSEVGQLRKAQEALNRLASDIIRNASLNNNFKLVMDWNALNPEDEAKLNNKPMIIIRKKQGSTVEFQSPPALPAYLFQLITFLVQAMEMVSGMTEALRGGRGGSTSGLQLEGMQLAAQTIIRLQARRVEDFMERLWSKAIPMVFQKYTGERVKTILGPNDEWQVFTFQRYAFMTGMNKPEDVFRDFGLKVTPGSSLASSKLQKTVMAGNLFHMGLIPGIDVLRQAEWHDPEGTLQKAREDAQAMAALRGPQGMQGLTGGRSKRHNQAFPAGGTPGV